MIGNMLSKIRKERRITKTKLAELTDINIGHLTHIEKGERNPSHKALKSICYALEIPYQELLYTYDKELSDEQLEYDYINYIPYNKIPAFSNLDNFVECPAKFANASFAYKAPDTSMEPLIKKDSYIYVEQSALLANKDIGLFFYNGEFFIRHLLYKKDKFVLKAENKEIKDIQISKNDNFYIIGKIYM
jgi:transcriptional regulator with XRE-family HTH domain